MGHSNDGPLVSIGVPVFNEEANLPRAMESLLAQSYARLQLIVSDNASTDATYAIARQYADRDPRVTVVRNETNLGMVENFNHVFRLSRGEYFMWAAADDRWHPSFVARCLEVLDDDPSVVLAHPLTIRVDEAGMEHGLMPGRLDTRGFDPLSRLILTMWVYVNTNHTYGLIRSSALRKTRLLRRVLGGDKVLLAELALLGAFAHVPEPLFYRRFVSGEDTTGDKVARRLHVIPVRGRWVVFPRLQMLYEYLTVGWHAPVSLPRRLALCATLVAGQATIYGRRLVQVHVVAR